MKKKIAFVLLSAFLTSSTLAVCSVPVPEIREQQVVSLLFIQTAEEVIVKQNSRNPERWMITLRSVSSDIAYFSEKPKKIAGKISIENFLEEWKSSLKNNPTGALVTRFSHANLEGNGSNRQIILSNPRFDSRNRTITYDAQNPQGKNNLSEGRHADPVLFIEKRN